MKMNCFIPILLFFAVQLTAQPCSELKIANQQLQGNTLIFDLYLNVTSSSPFDLYLNGSDFVIDFDANYFSNPNRYHIFTT